MEEKKLTDEEIVKSLENCATVGNCQECPYFMKDIDCREQRAENDYLDLIHRLQEENEDLKAKQKCHFELIDDKNEEICKQKAEIERMTEEKKTLVWLNQSLEKQVDELKKVSTKVIREKIPTRCDSCPFCLQRDNKDGTATIDWVCLADDTTRIAMATLHYTDTMYWKNDKCPLISVKDVQRQAVKDTAKEILDELDLFFKGTTFRKGYEFKKIDEKLKEIAERKGLEVE